MDAALPGHEDLSNALLENLICNGPLALRKDALKMLINPGKGCEGMADVLENLLRNPQEDHRIRMLAARALGQVGGKGSMQALLQSLDDEYPSVRHEAIAALGKIGDIGACEHLMKLLESESAFVRGACARALIQILGVPAPKNENVEMLTKLLCSEDMLVKEALLRIGTPAMTFLASRLGDDSFSIRSQASQVLAIHMRRLFDEMPARESFFDWLKCRGLFARTIGGLLAETVGDLYSFRITRLGKSVVKVENSGFDSISRTLCSEIPLRLPTAALIPRPYMDAVKTITLESLLSEYDAGSLILMGRTLVSPAASGPGEKGPVAKGCLAVKLCVKEGDVARLLHEAKMQEHLQGLRLSSSIPRPLGGLFRIEDLPTWIKGELGLTNTYAHAICYIASPDYFQYLADPGLSEEEMRLGLISCAKDLGRLGGTGLIHTSLIPLFHNRERTTGGDCTYRWNRKLAGRLDNWMESCRFPNLRRSGIADLEHLEPHPEVSSQSLQAYAGEHLFSMSLVLGCSFCRRGSLDRSAIAMSRDLKDCFQKYYSSLTGIEQKPLDDCIDWDHLACRMAEEMGVHIEPHLGRHNGPFPIPELLRAVHIASTFAVLELQSQLKAGSRV